MATACSVSGSGVLMHALRLVPGQDLKQALGELAQAHEIQAGIILTAVGSLRQAALRFAGQSEATVLLGPFELVSLVGTLSVEGLHLHGAIADAQGHTLGGHIMEGCLIYTTAEIVVGEVSQTAFRRQVDACTGYRELVIEALNLKPDA
ncbi:MAG: DNA-binding protein [Cyanobacteria bacterium Co-bin8]|nr:DNA-binding protein [Cyanobacteria bacterium Co-bin8]